MNISIFGLGYVGSVSLGCLAKYYKIIGVDISNKKVKMINNSISPIMETGLNELISLGVKRKNIFATKDFIYAIKNTTITFVCIGTPGMKNSDLNLISLFKSLKQIAEGLKHKNRGFHTIVIRSTIIPGLFDKIVNLIERYSTKKFSRDFCVIINPEFLREGSAVYDFFNPPMNIIGSKCLKGIEILKRIYSKNKAPTYIVSEDVAVIIKLISNAFHSIKITFANEVGNLCKKLNIDAFEVMKLFAADTKLNISSAYLKPGFAFGGSCLPKDIKALNKIARENFLEIPLISSVINSNEYQKHLVYSIIKNLNEDKIGVWGISFKVGTDDLRNSPVLDIIKLLIKDGYRIKIFDQNIDFKNIFGSNKSFVLKKIPDINKYFEKDFNKFLKFSKILLINSYDLRLISEILKYNHYKILDLLYTHELQKYDRYYGICW